MIEQAYAQTGKQVVVLIDEYDKPLLQALSDEKLTEEYRRILKAFYLSLIHIFTFKFRKIPDDQSDSIIASTSLIQLFFYLDRKSVV